MLGRRIRIGVDTGGTFTDVVAVDEDTGQIVTTKTPSTPTDPAEGFLLGVVKMLRVIEADQRVITTISHGTTVATNQLLEGRIARLGFITTDGYQFVLEIARQSVPDGYGNSYFWVKPDRIVPPDLVRTVRGRLDYTGAELEPFDETQAVAAARFFAERDIDTIGVCFLHAYANPSHELRMRDVFSREYPAAVVSLSCEVLPEYREYERSVTTLVDAAVKPTIGRYVQSVTRRLAELRPSGPAIPFYVMKSNGGVLSGTEVVHQPITTVLSGPAAGVLGAALVARQAGFDRVLTCDGGGTSTDVSVVLDGEPTMTTEGRIGAFPSKIPMIDVVTVGAGGGSVAWISPDCALKVGPRSAGAVPGPMCYPAGGSEVTVTDAHVALGRWSVKTRGRPASCRSRAMYSEADGSRSLGLRMKVLPQARATGNIQEGTMQGKLNGVMPATTPSWLAQGRQLSRPVETWSVKPLFRSCGIPHANSTTSMPRVTSPCASEKTLPCSLVMILASASRCSFSRFRYRKRIRARRTGGMSAQAGKAAAALATAAETSSVVAATTRRMTAPVAGLKTSSSLALPGPALTRPPIQW